MSAILLQLRAAADEKQRLFKFVDVVYFTRSKIAHGEVYSSVEIKEKLKKEFKKSEWTSGESILANLVAVLRASLRSILLTIGEKRFKGGFHSTLDMATLQSGCFDVDEFVKS